jgi:hypothetical protein
MRIFIYCSNPINFSYTFEIDDPYIYSLEDWRRLAEGNDALCLCGIALDDGYYQLSVGVTEPGVECELYSHMAIKEEHLSEELTNAIDEAVELNLKFKD